MEEKNTVELGDRPGLDLDSVEELEESLNATEEKKPEDASVLTHAVNELEGIITEENVSSYKEYLETLNFVEVLKASKEVKQYFHIMEDMKNSALSLKKLTKSMRQLEDDVKEVHHEELSISNEIEASNIEDDALWKDADAFLDHYDTSIENLNKIDNIIAEKIKEFDDIPKTTAYMSTSMLEVININLQKIEESGSSSYTRAKKYYLNQREIFSHRDSIDWIYRKMLGNKQIIRNLKKSLKDDKKKGKENVLKITQKNTAEAFGKVFSLTQLTMFEEYLSNLYESKTAAFYVQYGLYLLYTHEKRFGKVGNHKWVEIVIMNVLDIMTEHYDLESGVGYYRSQLLKLLEVIE